MGGSNIHLKGVLEEANKENEKKAIFDKLLAKNFFRNNKKHQCHTRDIQEFHKR